MLVLLLLPALLRGQTVSGTITDHTTGETLIGATVLDEVSGKGTTTNAHGRYTLTLRGGEKDSVVLRVSYIGYQTQHHRFVLRDDHQLNVRLHPSVMLEEVNVTADRINSPQASQMSAIEVPVEKLKMVPVIFGETDVLKTIQLLPGVQSGTEGMSGMYVRGGGADENLFLLDGVPLYNVNHLGGFFSAFNGDAIKNVTLYKGSFPARFSGRISSVLDITTNNGNDQEWHGGLSVGLISAKVNVEGPIIKERTTLSFSLRRTYGDLLIQPALWIASKSEEIDGLGAGYYFYDLNSKITHKFNDRSRLYFSIYSGDDAAYMSVTEKDNYANVKSSEKIGFSYKWGNFVTALRWNYELTPRLFMNLSASYSRYRQSLGLEGDYNWKDLVTGDSERDEFEMKVNSGIRDFAMRADFDYAPAPEHAIKFGGSATLHHFRPQVNSLREKATGMATIDTTLNDNSIVGGEFNLYAEDDWSVADVLKVNMGVALTGFAVQGEFYPSVQPRLSGRLLLSNSFSLKAGYSYMTQYMHLLTSTNISLPTDLWVPVTAQIDPMNSHQVALGGVYSWKYGIDFSVEGYYKWMNNLLEYRPGSTFLGNSSGWENMVCMGKGWAYGIELMAQRNFGKLTGWVAYTWSRSWRQFDRIGEELNGGKAFPAKYDRVHDISITLQYKHSDRFDCGATWVFSSGNTATLATQQIPAVHNNWSTSLDFVEERNNFRLPSYHRLDVGVNFHKQKRHGIRTWSISVYNLYNRQNPFLVYPRSREAERNGQLYVRNSLVQRSLFPIIPSVTYSYKF